MTYLPSRRQSDPFLRYLVTVPHRPVFSVTVLLIARTFYVPPLPLIVDNDSFRRVHRRRALSTTLLHRLAEAVGSLVRVELSGAMVFGDFMGNDA